jgi:AraC-like DNA-binding protein
MIDKTVSQSSGRLHQPATLTRTPASHLTEAPTWASVPCEWKILYGSFYELGVSIEWHSFRPDHPFHWSRSFHPQSLELCLNLAGHGVIKSRFGKMAFEAQTAGFYLPGKAELEAWRQEGEEHRFVTLEFSAGYLRRHLTSCDGSLDPTVEKFLRHKQAASGFGQIAPLTLEHQQLVEQLLHPPVYQGARSLWYQSKVLQLIVDFCFGRGTQDELFCDRQKRLARERVNRVTALLRDRLAEPPSLEEIGRLVGCSPFYLSRTFSNETHSTIPQYLRKLRMERAAELLRSGKFNVTEAAMEVGYSSLSHFSHAFCQVMGCCPALYPLGLKKAVPLSNSPTTR